ncbi:NPCBM/NEW2 domain-containing protein [Neobacillus drentensis]|uniref:NPCBM/NEW2 domain-containing protein n=1 Tax=Neobacillus drentensis TaxID=220684 RepID=UPI001F44D834|nr:NPCBM/NEW2 domain-containing protein [Neobacillus drentensis]ULT56742.1 NPCBM/NEW2 domain-containing protein [Neobacillus drentensis]
MASNKSLTTKYNSLVASDKSLTTKYNSLVASDKSLTTKYNNLVASDKSLTTKYNNLAAENTKLKGSLASIISQKNGTIYIDGSKEGNGDFVSYNGKQYVSVDGIVPALRGENENYKYVTSSNSLYVGTFPISGAIQLTNLPYYSYNNTIYINRWDDESNFFVNGKRMLTGLGVNLRGSWDGNASMQYKLNGKYKELSFKAGMDDKGIGSGETGSIVVYADGNVIYDSGSLETQEDAKAVTLDVTDVKLLSVEFVPDGGYYYDGMHFVFGDPILTP